MKTLPPSNLERAADYIHRLARISDQERRSILERTAGLLTRQEADELERVIAEGCGVVDRGIAENLADFKASRAYGPFRTHTELIASLHAEARKLRASKKPKRASRA